MNGNKTHGIGPGGLKCGCCLPGHYGWSKRNKVKQLLARRARRDTKRIIQTETAGSERQARTEDLTT